MGNILKIGQKFENQAKISKLGKIWKSGKILEIGQNFENRATFWKSGKILKILQNFENRAKIWKSGQFLKIGQNFGNQAKFWKSGKILKIRQNFENRAKFWKFGQNFENGAILKCASYPAKNWSHKSAHHLPNDARAVFPPSNFLGQMMRGDKWREMGVDTRCLPGAVWTGSRHQP